MIQRDGKSVSLWQESAMTYQPLNEADSSKLYDVVIAGGGITGITTALLLQNAGMNCLVIEAHNICYGTTGGTTAHINTLLDVPYTTIEKNFSKEKAQFVADSLQEAIHSFQENIKKYKIDCGFKTATATLFAQDDKQQDELEKISEATAGAGVDNKFVNKISIPIPFLKAMQVKGQAKFNPVRYVHSLAEEFEKAGGTILELCRVLSAEETENIVIETARKIYSKIFNLCN